MQNVFEEMAKFLGAPIAPLTAEDEEKLKRIENAYHETIKRAV